MSDKQSKGTAFWYRLFARLRQFAADFDRILDDVAPASDERVLDISGGPVPDDPDRLEDWRRSFMRLTSWS